jgi:CheY-like chemotaxis protein
MRTLLLADDSVTVQRVIALTFADEQIRVITCGDGQQAMERMAAQRPDILLAGTQLPGVSGYDLARFMRSKPELQHVPVLLLSGAFETVDEARLKASGANGVIEKPVEPTNVIGRVKELLGLKSDAKPATAGRLITSPGGPAEKKLPVATPPRAVTSTRGTPSKWEQPRDQTRLEPDTRSVEDASTRSDDYLDTLDAAFDTLDQQLSGRAASAKPSRNPSGPLGQSSGAADPRSPGRRPQNGASTPGNPVFEVDDEWFGGDENQARADARAGRREIQEDLSDPDLKAPMPGAPPSAVFEVDDDWFAEDNKARAAKADEHRLLAAEMGIHDVELPHAEPAPNAPAPPSDLDFDFGLDDIKRLQDSAPPVVEATPESAISTPEPVQIAPASEPVAIAPEPVAITPAPAPVAVMPDPVFVAPMATVPAASASAVADDFAQLLAFEQGEHHEPPMPPAPEIRIVTPEITETMLDQIAARVADRLNGVMFGEQMKTAMTETVRQTVREIVADTSERLVRDEIDRIKNKSK